MNHESTKNTMVHEEGDEEERQTGHSPASSLVLSPFVFFVSSWFLLILHWHGFDLA
jgi:hypothetical protein